MRIQVFNTYQEISREAAILIAEKIRNKPGLVLGLATGSTPLGVYQELIQMHRDQTLDFSQVTTFNLDEYVGLPPDHPQSYHYFMWENLFKHININPSQVNIPDGMAQNIDSHCEWYENQIKKAGGIDLQLLGIGANGHIAFNEPGSSLGSLTRIKPLTLKTIKDNARFFNSEDEVPKSAITMGINTIMNAHEIVLLANGKNKAQAVKSMIEGPISTSCPASILQMHRKATIFLDKESAGDLRIQ